MRNSPQLSVRELYSEGDIAYCVDMYRALSDESFLVSDRATAILNLWKLVRMKRFVRCLTRDGVIVAWLYADAVQLLHTTYPVFQQMYYASDQTGTMAVRCITMLHDAMEDYAVEKGFSVITSPGSHMDENFVFARVLARHGWQRRGYGAARRVGGSATFSGGS